jgi:putative membrane protein insertion efficiency factor
MLWTVATPVRLLLIVLVKLYRATLSGWLGGQCRFYPTCSHYAEDAVRTHGVVRGVALAAWRIVRCGPFTAGGVDHVPPSRRDRAAEPATLGQGAGA